MMLQSLPPPLHTQLTTGVSGCLFFLFLHKSNPWLFTFFWFGLVFMWHIKVVLDMSNFRKFKNLKDLQHWRAELQAKLQSLRALWIMHQFQAPAKSQTYWFPFEKLTEQVQHTLCAKSVSLFANLKTHKTSQVCGDENHHGLRNFQDKDAYFVINNDI